MSNNSQFQIGTSSTSNLQNNRTPPINTQLWVKNEIEKQVQTDKASLITIFGTFAAILTFLTVEFQFLKSLSTIGDIVGFTMILFSLLVSFVLIIDYVIKVRTQPDIPKPFIGIIIFILIILAMGVLIMYTGRYEDRSKVDKQFNELNDKVKNYEGRLDQLQKQLDQEKLKTIKP
jgi:amino acid transporter